jgi:uncharacterized protein
VRIAVVGSGISGLVCAHLLDPRHDVVLLEAEDRLGGHTHTHDVREGDRTVAVDSGFIVFNTRTYPSFIQLLQRLGVPSQPTDMSFGVRSERRDLEYAAHDLAALYAQRRNLLSPRFHRMVLDVLRFYREARELLGDGPDLPLLEWLRRRRYSAGFVEDHLLPMVGAVWSSSRASLDEFPARFLVRFLENHGFLQVDGRPPWRTVVGGSREYVRAIAAGFRGEIRTGCPVQSIRRTDDAVWVRSGGSRPERFDHMVIAAHADHALRMLADPSPLEQDVLGQFTYRRNEVVLHHDPRVMPRRPRAWASWNYHLDDEGGEGACVTYWMNRLQRITAARDYFVTLNRAVAPDHTIARMTYHHPVYTPRAVAAQQRHGELIGHRRTSYCGAYWRNGFHEDGVVSALRVCQRFGVGLGEGPSSAGEELAA